MKTLQRTLRRRRVRAKIVGTAARPRLTIHISSRHVLAQLIDDAASQTLAYVTTVGQADAGKTMTDKAKWVGDQIGQAAKAHKISTVVFDRGERQYHGRTRALAEAARKTGLKF